MTQETLQKTIDPQTQLFMKLADCKTDENIKRKREVMLKKYEQIETNLYNVISQLQNEAANLRRKDMG